MIKDVIKGTARKLAARIQARCAISREGVRPPVERPENFLARPPIRRAPGKDYFQPYGGTP
jgi:hypothetical protein